MSDSLLSLIFPIHGIQQLSPHFSEEEDLELLNLFADYNSRPLKKV